MASRRADVGARVRGGPASALVERVATWVQEFVADSPAHASLAGSVALDRRSFCAAVLRRAEELASGGATRRKPPPPPASLGSEAAGGAADASAAASGNPSHADGGGSGGAAPPVASRASVTSLATSTASGGTRHFPSFRPLFDHKVLHVEIDNSTVRNLFAVCPRPPAPQRHPPVA